MDHKNTRSAEVLKEALDLHIERNTKYQSAYKKFGPVMARYFPDGLTIKTEDDWNRLMVFMTMVSKVQRYAANFSSGGHMDSIKDNIVYNAMLAELDESREEASYPNCKGCGHSKHWAGSCTVGPCGCKHHNGMTPIICNLCGCDVSRHTGIGQLCMTNDCHCPGYEEKDQSP